MPVEEAELSGAFAGLAAAGCGPGYGISVRVFFDEDNARRWLAW